MSHALPYVFAALAALSVGVIVVSFWQSVRAALGLIGTDEVAEEAFSGGDRDLLSHRKAVLAGLRELDFDHEAGKLSDEDHREARAKLRAEAKQVMQAIDAAVAPHRASVESLVDTRLGAPKAAPAKAEVSAEPETSVPMSGPTSRACPACSTDNDPDAAFCKRCGKPLASEAVS